MVEKDLLQAGYRYALALTHNVHDAEDLVQECCARLFQKYGHLRGKSFLFRTIHNLYVDQHRRSKLVVFETFTDAPSPAHETTSYQAVAMEELGSALEKIRPEEREAVYLQACEGMSAAKIAKLTGRSRGTVLSLIHRGKQKLQQLLQRSRAADLEADHG